jgi:hypothetical protein
MMDASNYSMEYVLSAPETSKVPIAPIGKWLTCPNRLPSFNWDPSLVLPGKCSCQPRLQTSHPPHGRLTCCLLFAGRRCLCLFRLFRHGHNHVFLDHWQHSFWISACSCSKFPIAPMGDSRVACCLQGGGVYFYIVYGGTVSIVNSQIYSNTANGVRANAQKFPLPRWEDG